MPTTTTPTSIDDEGNTYHLISNMPKLYPHYCETCCAAWNKYSHYCFATIMSKQYCNVPVLKIEERIAGWAKWNGPTWWKKKVKLDDKGIDNGDE